MSSETFQQSYERLLKNQASAALDATGDSAFLKARTLGVSIGGIHGDEGQRSDKDNRKK